MDIVYLVGPDRRHDQLRHSLRSLVNLPHDRVWLFGQPPDWLAGGATAVGVAPDKNKFRATERNLIAACEEPDVSDPFLLFNDDFYIMTAMAEAPTLHRGPVAEVIEWYAANLLNGRYLAGMKDTYGLLKDLGYDDALSYELHAPMVIHKWQMLDVLDIRRGINCYHWRTVYGNLAQLGGTRSDDCKVYPGTVGSDWLQWPLLSTSDQSWRTHRVGRYIRVRYPTPSPYEGGPPWHTPTYTHTLIGEGV